MLENVNMVDSDKLAKNLELLKKKPDYNPYDEEFDEHGKLKVKTHAKDQLFTVRAKITFLLYAPKISFLL